jgi:hypothetical protein
MSDSVVTQLLPIVLVMGLATSDLWVYLDDKKQCEQGSPVVFATRSFRVETPVAWLVGCLLLWLAFFPIYLVARRHEL